MVRKALTATAAVISCVAMLAGGVVASATETVPAQDWSDTVRGGDSILATSGDGNDDSAGTAGGPGSVTGTDDPSAQTPGADSSASGGQTSQSDNPSDDSVDTSGESAGSDGTSPSDSDAGSAGTLIGGLGGTDGATSPSAGDSNKSTTSNGQTETLAGDDCPAGVDKNVACKPRWKYTSNDALDKALEANASRYSGISPYGTSINLFDYWLTTQDSQDAYDDSNEKYRPCMGKGASSQGCADNLGINQYSPLRFRWDYWQVRSSTGTDRISNAKHPWEAGYSASNSPQVSGHTDAAYGPNVGIVTGTLGDDGYPKLSGRGVSSNDPHASDKTMSLAYLFDSSEREGKARYTNVGGLLQTDADGSYGYDAKKNFASYDQQRNRFTLYDPSVKPSREEKDQPVGQFLPFNTGVDVFESGDANGNLKMRSNINSDWNTLNHYFGLTMSTRFTQPVNGEAKPGKKMTYNFSGDDDVWVYIDGVLVGDLGGIHKRMSLEIDFSTGEVRVFDDKNRSNTYDASDTLYTMYGQDANGKYADTKATTLKDYFTAAGKADQTQWNGNTFANDTDHQLDFFYLERGNMESNMSLKTNLVSVASSRIEKTDQDGAPMPGVNFTLSSADKNYTADGKYKYSGTTGADGTVTLTKGGTGVDKDTPVSLDQVHHQSQHWVLHEEEQSGYRMPRDAHLRFENPCTDKDGNSVGEDNLSTACVTNWLLSDNQWESGAYATGQVRTTIPQSTLSQKTIDVWNPNSENPDTTEPYKWKPTEGTLFAVVMKYTGPEDPKKKVTAMMRTDSWSPIIGNIDDGWNIADTVSASNWDEVRDFAKKAGLVFGTNSSGGLYLDINDLPGDITSYYFTLKEKYGTVEHKSGKELNEAIAKELKYTVAYFYSDASSIDDVTATGKNAMMRITVPASKDFEREFSTTLRVANMRNTLRLVKTNMDGDPLEGAEFALYRDGYNKDQPNQTDTQVTAAADGSFTENELMKTGLKTDANGVLNTSDNASDLKELRNGSYLIAETKAPDGYQMNDAATVKTETDGTLTGGIRFIVDASGIRVNAGTEHDGVTTRIGLGRLAYSLRGFATADDVDSTLHDVQAYPVNAAEYQGPDSTHWLFPRGTGHQSFTYTTNPDGKYAPMLDGNNNPILAKGWHAAKDTDDKGDKTSYRYYEADSGWNKLVITQDFHARHDSASGHEAAKHDIGDVDLNRLFTDDVTIYVADPRETGAMTVSKQVQGVGGDVTRFSFDLTAWSDDELLSERYGQEGRTFPATLYATDGARPEQPTGSVSFTCATGNTGTSSSCTGTYTPNNATPVTGNPAFTLKDNQTLLIDGLPVGTKVTVTEHDYMPKGYATTVAIGSTTAVSRTTDDLKGTGNKSLAVIPEPKDSKDSPLTIAFTNRYIRVASLPFTGGPWTAAWLILAGTGLLGLACAAHRLARRRQTHAGI